MLWLYVLYNVLLFYFLHFAIKTSESISYYWKKTLSEKISIGLMVFRENSSVQNIRFILPQPNHWLKLFQYPYIQSNHFRQRIKLNKKIKIDKKKNSLLNSSAIG